MKKIFISLSLLICINLSAQRVQRINTEIKSLFLDTLHSWNDIIQKAKSENKYIYLFSNGDSPEYGYKLEQEFLPQSIKKYLIENFILINLRTKYSNNDGYIYTYIQQKFIDSIILVESISDMPVHIIYNKLGSPIAKSIFTFPDTTFRIKYLKDILNGKNRYYSLLKEYRKGNRKANFIRQFHKAYEGAVFYHDEDTVRIFEEFIKAYPNKSIFTKANAKLIYENADLMLFSDCSRNLFLNRKEWYKILGKQKVDERIIDLLCSDFETIALIENNYTDKNKSFEKTKEAYLMRRKEYKEYFDIVFSKSLKKLLNE